MSDVNGFLTRPLVLICPGGGYEFTFVTDATCAKRSARFGEQDMKEHIVDIMAAFANLITTDELLNRREDV